MKKIVLFTILALSLFASGRLRYQFFPATEGDVVFATLTMPRGTPIAITAGAVEQIEDAARRLQTEIEAEFQTDSILHVLTTVGDHQGRSGPPDISVSSGGSHLGEVSIELTPSTLRDFESGWAANRWRALTGPVTDAVTASNLGTAYLNLGEFPKAIEYFEERLVIASELGDRQGEDERGGTGASGQPDRGGSPHDGGLPGS